MPMVMGRTAASLVALAALLGACTPQGPASDLPDSSASLSTPPSSVSDPGKQMTGLEAEYCPTVTLLEGTAILTKKIGNEIDYVASISDTSRDCRIQNGKLAMHVGMVGRITPGPVAQNRTVTLPIRVAIRRGTDVVYSRLGKKSVPITKGGGTQTFTYVDADIAIDQPTQRNVTVLVGFDEGGG